MRTYVVTMIVEDDSPVDATAVLETLDQHCSCFANGGDSEYCTASLISVDTVCHTDDEYVSVSHTLVPLFGEEPPQAPPLQPEESLLRRAEDESSQASWLAAVRNTLS